MAQPPLGDYQAKRHFDRTPEPPATAPGAEGQRSQRPTGHGGGDGEVGQSGARWVVQQHAARRLHYDFRLEVDGVLVSWAVPKGPSYDPASKRLAVKVEDHPLEYRNFEGLIPGGNYGAGRVIVWDEGNYRNLSHRGEVPLPMPEAIESGHISFWLEGSKLMGGWSLTRSRPGTEDWILVKRNDEHAHAGRDITAEAQCSVRSGLTLAQVGASTGPTPAPEAVPAAATAPEAVPAAALPGRTAGRAEFFSPMLAQAVPGDDPAAALSAEAGQWVFEPKLDGLRGQAVRNGAMVEIYSRNRLSFKARFPAIVDALAHLSADNFVLDGELVTMVDDRPSFAAMQQGAAGEAEYWVFDVLWLLGHDVRHLVIEQRKELLEKVLEPSPLVKLVPVLDGDAAQLLGQACSQGWEGLVAKRAGSAYAAGRSGDWRKLKCACRQELIICGYTRPRRSRTGFGALLLGYWQDGRLLYAGKVGTGFTQALLKQLHQRLDALSRPSSPFIAPVPEKDVVWVEPLVVAEVSFSNWTADARLRHPSFLGLRPDKDAGAVVHEPAGPVPGRANRRPSGLKGGRSG